jgi:hypothetical protein
MKMLIQVSLIAVLVFTVLQTTTVGSIALPATVSSHVTRNISITPAQGFQVTTCHGFTGVSRVKPTVGWNT